MDIVCALVGEDGFQVAHVAEDGVFVGDAVSPQNVARRAGSFADPQALNYHLSPEGFGDGGIMITAEFTNNHRLLAGMKATVEAAQWLGESKDAEAWEKEYADFEQTFQKASARDAKTDGEGNRYIPAEMGPATPEHPTRSQWALLHGVYPGRIFAKNDPLMLGTLKMMEAHEVQSQGGLVEDCGWSSIWTACSSFYARDLLWLGEGGRQPGCNMPSLIMPRRSGITAKKLPSSADRARFFRMKSEVAVTCPTFSPRPNSSD